jgi:hypothetical protein
VGGLNTVAAGIALPPGDCVQAFNIVAAENGLRVRYGEHEHVTGLTGATDNVVRVVMQFTGATTTRLFATTSSGIWDVTNSTAAPTLTVAFPSTASNAGYGVACVVVTTAGHFLMYADEENGLYRYAESGATWTKVTMGAGVGQISNVDPKNLVSVVAFKGRVWLVERDSDSAWYLPTDSVAGAATEFPMGMKFARGGTLVGLWSWTYDGGAGVDDRLVAWASGGDVLVYEGTDPSVSTSFGLSGVWYAGPPPAGRKVATDLGGELLLITRQGLLPLSRLVVRVVDVQTESTTVKVANLINTLMSIRGDTRGWAIIQHPEDATLLLVVPKGSGDYYLQLAQSAASKGWFIHRGLNMTSADIWQRRLYYGTDNGRVCINTGYLDGVTISNPNAYAPIDWSLLTAASDLGSPVQKQVGTIRPLILSDGVAPSFAVAARYGYSQEELGLVSLVTGGDNTWDVALWDTATWSGDIAPSQAVRGSTGMGTAVAIAIRGVSVSRTVLVALDVTFTSGGFL